MRLKVVSTKKNNNYSIIRDYTNSFGKRTTCIYENLGNDDKLKERFGYENTFEELNKYINELNQLLKDGIEPPVILTLDPNKRIEKDAKHDFYISHLFLRKIYYDLGIDKICKTIKDKYNFTFDINLIVECLLYARIIWPSSKLSTYEISKKFLGNYDIDIQHVYRTLTYLAKESNNIQKQLFDNSNKIIDRNYKVIYYDCTNYFFYTEEDDFKRYGISKQHQPLPLVQMGLFMDADGYPFAMNINPGNTSEGKTMIPTEINFLNNFDMKDKNIVVCTDAAMCNDDIKSFNIKNGRGFIITQSIKKLSNELQEFVLDKKGWRILGNINDIYDLSTVTDEFKKEHFETIFYKEIECETKSVNQTLIVTFSFKYEQYQHKLKVHQFERAKTLVEEVNKKNKNAKKKKDVEKIKLSKNQNDPKRFIIQTSVTDSGEEAKNVEYSVSNEIFENEEKYNGLYGITTNLINDTSTIIKVIHGRWEIEESFRIMKNEFDAGTVYLSREDRITGHFITCFLSLFIYRYLEHQLNEKYTAHEIISELQKMKILEQKGKGYQPIYTRTDLTDDLHSFLGLNTDNEILTYKKFKNFFKNQGK